MGDVYESFQTPPPQVINPEAINRKFCRKYLKTFSILRNLFPKAEEVAH